MGRFDEYANRVFSWDGAKLGYFYDNYVVKWLNNVMSWTALQAAKAFANIGGAVNVSVIYPTDGVSGGNTYTLAGAIAVIPSAWQRGGMKVKFIDSTSNKYVEWKLVTSSWSSTESNWEVIASGLDAVPTTGSVKPVQSGGVQNEIALGAVYDVSAKNPTAGPNNDGKFTLEYIFNQNNVNTLIPTAYRKGGMSIKFIQSSDNKYIQFRLKKDSFSTVVAEWEEDCQLSKVLKVEGVNVGFSLIQGEYVEINGVITQNAEYSRTNYIDLSIVKKLHVNIGANSNYNVFFNKDKEKISSFTNTAGEHDIIVPESAAYVIFSGTTSNMSTFECYVKENINFKDVEKTTDELNNYINGTEIAPSFTDGKWVSTSDGGEHDASGQSVTDYINIRGLNSISITAQEASNNNVFYDINKQPILYNGTTAYGFRQESGNAIAVPYNACYARFSISTNKKSGFKVKFDTYNSPDGIINMSTTVYESKAAARAAVPYAIRKSGTILIYRTASSNFIIDRFGNYNISYWSGNYWTTILETSDIQTLQTTLANLAAFVQGTELSPTFTDGEFISPNTGNVAESSSYARTDYIDIRYLNSVVIVSQEASSFNAFYDINKNYVSGFKLNTDSNAIAIPPAVCFMRCSLSKNKKTGFKVKYDTYKSPYGIINRFGTDYASQTAARDDIPYRMRHAYATYMYSLTDGRVIVEEFISNDLSYWGSTYAWKNLFDSATFDVVKENKATKESALISASTHGYALTRLNNNLVLAWGSDYHGDTKMLQGLVNYAESYNVIDAILNTGDTMQENPVTSADILTSITGYTKPFMQVIGNHDNGYGTTADKMGSQQLKYEKFIAPFIDNIGMVQPAGAGENNFYPCYYYKDFSTYKIRLIVVDNYEAPKQIGEGGVICNQDTTCISEAQANFVGNALSSLQEDWSVIIACHTVNDTQVPAVTNKFTTRKIQGQSISEATYQDVWVIKSLVNAFTNKTSLSTTVNYTGAAATILAYNSLPTSYNLSFDFSSRTNSNFICYLNGHKHYDAILSKDGQMYILVDTGCSDAGATSFSDIVRDKDHASCYTFNAIAFDTENKKINIVRIGCDMTMYMERRDFVQLDY